MREILYFALLAILSSSCYSLVNLTEAQSYGKGVVALEGSGELVAVPIDKKVSTLANSKIQIGVGATDDLDFKININSMSFMNIGVKYQIIDQENMDFAIGGRLQTHLRTILLARNLGSLSNFVNPAVDFHWTFNLPRSKLLFNPSFSYTSFPLNNSPINAIFANLSFGSVYELDPNARLKFGVSAGTLLVSPTFVAAASVAFEYRLNNNLSTENRSRKKSRLRKKYNKEIPKVAFNYK